jgi:methylthioribose-1-phosphate isomerase
MRARLRPLPPEERAAAAFARADAICEEDVEINRGSASTASPSSATSRAQGAGRARPAPDPLQRGLARDRGLGHRDLAHLPRRRGGHPVHVFVDETRPRNQGAQLTAWELKAHGRAARPDRGQRGRPPDAARRGRHGDRRHRPDHRERRRVQQDRTYLKALAAKANGVPFYVALPSPTIDWTVRTA